MSTAGPTPAMTRERAQEIAGSFDLRALPPDFYANPFPVYAALREHEPVRRMPDGSWFLTRYADLVAVYRDAQGFSSDKKVEFTPKYGEGSHLLAHHTTSLVFNDPPLHTRVRKLIMGALTRRAIAGMEPGLVALVDQLLDAIGERGGGDLSRARSRSRSSATCWTCRARSAGRCAHGRSRSSARSNRSSRPRNRRWASRA